MLRDLRLCVVIVSIRGGMVRDAPDGATVYADLCVDSASGVSCHDVDSRRGCVLGPLVLEASLLCLTRSSNYKEATLKSTEASPKSIAESAETHVRFDVDPMERDSPS